MGDYVQDYEWLPECCLKQPALQHHSCPFPWVGKRSSGTQLYRHLCFLSSLEEMYWYALHIFDCGFQPDLWHCHLICRLSSYLLSAHVGKRYKKEDDSSNTDEPVLYLLIFIFLLYLIFADHIKPAGNEAKESID